MTSQVIDRAVGRERDCPARPDGPDAIVAVTTGKIPMHASDRNQSTAPAFAVGRLRDVRLGTDIVAYLDRIDATLSPFDGRFIVHGGVPEVLEGVWEGDLVVIGFPSREAARAWYGSPAYREILPLRTENAVCDVLLIDGVLPDHRAPEVLNREAAPDGAAG